MTNVLHVHSFPQHFIDNPVQIGGQGIEVEIDESKFWRRKYNRGRWQEGHWVFGGIERVTGNSFLVEVEKRDAATLVPLIQQFIWPGSVIFSMNGEPTHRCNLWGTHTIQSTTARTL